MPQKPKSYTSERLIIQPTTLADAEFILELFNTPKWLKNVGDRNIHSLREAEEYIETKILPTFEKLGYSNYTVIRKSDAAKMGTCGLFDREGLEGIDLGFAFLTQFEKQGYAFESASIMKEIGLKEYHLKEISAITIKENLASQRLLKKLEFKFERIIRLPNESEDLLLFSFKPDTA